MCRRLMFLLAVGLVLSAQRGWCLTAETIPESGAIVAGVENEANILIQCEVRTSTAVQRVTAWFIMRTTDASAIQITNDNPDFTITGDPVPGEALLYNTNLTILNLTAEFDRAVVFCGETTERDLANFTIRIYTPPVLQDVGIVPAVEGYAFPNGSLGLEQNEPFPIPTDFTWTTDNETLMNSSRLDLGYPDLTIDPVNRSDTGRYTLTASNFRLDNDTALIGTGSGGFYLDVYYGPEFTDDPSQLDEAGTLEGDPITLVCGENLDGNPTPVVEWTDSTGTPVPRNLSSRYTFNDGPGVVNLSLSSTMATDSGNWTCTVRGEEPLPPITRIISVFFLEPPSPPLNVRLDTDGTGITSLGIQWFPPAFEGVPPFSSYNFYVDPPTGFDYSTARLDELNETTRAFNVTELLPGVTYQLTVTAVSEAFGAVAESNRSDAFEATTATTVPLPECYAPRAENGMITISWGYVHTGGLNLTSVQVLYRVKMTDEYLGWVEGDASCTSNCSVDLFNLTAGTVYVALINASNEEGYMTAICPEIRLEIGIPTLPMITLIESNAVDKVTISLQVPEAGLSPTNPTLYFDILATNDTSEICFKTELQDYEDGTDIQFTVCVPGLVPGQEYTFSVRVRNEFGLSDFVEFGTPVRISEEPPTTSISPQPTSSPIPTDPGDSGGDDDNAAAIAGGVVGGLIAVILLILIVLVIIYLIMRYRAGAGSYKVEGGGRHVKVEEVEIDIGDELQRNNDAAARDLHYAELDSFKKPPPKDAAVEVVPPIEEPVEYATIQAVAPKKQATPPPAAGAELGDESLTSTSLV